MRIYNWRSQQISQENIKLKERNQNNNLKIIFQDSTSQNMYIQCFGSLIKQSLSLLFSSQNTTFTQSFIVNKHGFLQSTALYSPRHHAGHCRANHGAVEPDVLRHHMPQPILHCRRCSETSTPNRCPSRCQTHSLSFPRLFRQC